MYRLNGTLRDVINCFCAQCRKTSGHHVAATAVLTNDLELFSQDTLKYYRSSGQASRGFCSECGSSLLWQLDGADTKRIMAGTLESPTGLVAVQNCFLEEKSDYHAPPVVSNRARVG